MKAVKLLKCMHYFSSLYVSHPTQLDGILVAKPQQFFLTHISLIFCFCIPNRAQLSFNHISIA